mgnify:CR=1 FL=1
MSVPGYRINLKRSGSPTATTGESFSADGTNRYQIDATGKRVWDRFTTPTFKDSGGTTISSTEVKSVDYLFGRVTFKSTQGTGLTGDVTYLPMSDIGGANSFTLNQTADLLDDTDFSSTGFRSRKVGLHDISMSVSRYTPSSTALDFWKNYIGRAGSTEIVVEIQTETTGPFARGFFVLSQDSRSGDVGSLESEDIELSLEAPVGADAPPFGWSDI